MKKISMDHVFVVLGVYEDYKGVSYTYVLLVTPSDELSKQYVEGWKKNKSSSDYSIVWRVDADITLP